jgi:TctA family transporter
MVGAMTIHGITPGPQVMTERPELFWGMIASMWIGNLMLVILNLPLIGIWVKLLSVPYRILYPAILLFCCIGGVQPQQQRGRLGPGIVAGCLGIAHCGRASRGEKEARRSFSGVIDDRI